MTVTRERTVKVGFSATEEVAVSAREAGDASRGSASWAKTCPLKARKERIADAIAALIRIVGCKSRVGFGRGRQAKVQVLWDDKVEGRLGEAEYLCECAFKSGLFESSSRSTGASDFMV